MMIRKGVLYVLLLLMMGCQENSIKEKLLQPDVIWHYEIQKYRNSKEKVSANLVFKENGYVYEDNNRFLKYKWSINLDGTILILNNQEFKIMKNTQDKLHLLHIKNQTKALLSRN